MLKPGPRLRDLITRATPEQAERARLVAEEHRRRCVKDGIEPGIAETVLAEALEIEIRELNAGDDDPELEVRRRLELHTGRDYSRSYTER